MSRSFVRLVLRRWLAVALIVQAAGCAFNPANLESSHSNSNGGTHTIPGLTSLSISPTSAKVTLMNGGPAQTQQFRVTGIVNGQMQDLTSQVAWSSSRPGIAAVDGNGLATTLGGSGGTVSISATANGITATATLVVYYTFTGADPGSAGSTVPPNAGMIFSSNKNDPTRAPGLVYPNEGVLFPPNITGIEVHFTPGNNNTLFQVGFVGPGSSINTFIRCTAPSGINGCIYLPDPTIWSAVALSNAGLGRVTVTVRGTDDSGTAIGTSSDLHIQFAKDNILGALYYWTTSGSTAIVRWDFAGSTSKPTPYLTPANTDGKTCVGCHALAPDGDKLVASVGGQNDGRLLLWNIMTDVAQQAFPLAQKSQFESWNKDGTQFVGIYGDDSKMAPVNLMTFDGTSGMVTDTIDLGGLRADHPDWSKNTSGPETIAFTSVDPTAPTTDQRPATGGIDIIQRQGSGWTAPKTLVASELGKNRYYPNIAPDGNLLVYDESTCTNGTPTAGQMPDKSCDADTDATATVFLTSVGGMTPIPLTAANSPGIADQGNTALTNSFPKWAPFVEDLDEMNHLIWLTFSSTRQYGLRSPPAPASHDETNIGTLIWMVGVNPSVGSSDPSYPAFCLPFQDVTTSNHIAQWTKYFIMGPG